MYEYHAILDRAVDGDTAVVRLDLGFGVQITQTLRLRGINTPELRSHDPAERAAAQQALARLRELLPPGRACTVKTFKDAQEKYGRYLADILLEDGTDVVQTLLREGLGRPYDGGAR